MEENSAANESNTFSISSSEGLSLEKREGTEWVNDLKSLVATLNEGQKVGRRPKCRLTKKLIPGWHKHTAWSSDSSDTSCTSTEPNSPKRKFEKRHMSKSKLANTLEALKPKSGSGKRDYKLPNKSEKNGPARRKSVAPTAKVNAPAEVALNKDHGRSSSLPKKGTNTYEMARIRTRSLSSKNPEANKNSETTKPLKKHKVSAVKNDSVEAQDVNKPTAGTETITTTKNNENKSESPSPNLKKSSSNIFSQRSSRSSGSKDKSRSPRPVTFAKPLATTIPLTEIKSPRKKSQVQDKVQANTNKPSQRNKPFPHIPPPPVPKVKKSESSSMGSLTDEASKESILTVEKIIERRREQERLEKKQKRIKKLQMKPEISEESFSGIEYDLTDTTKIGETLKKPISTLGTTADIQKLLSDIREVRRHTLNSLANPKKPVQKLTLLFKSADPAVQESDSAETVIQQQKAKKTKRKNVEDKRTLSKIYDEDEQGYEVIEKLSGINLVGNDVIEILGVHTAPTIETSEDDLRNANDIEEILAKKYEDANIEKILNSTYLHTDVPLLKPSDACKMILDTLKKHKKNIMKRNTTTKKWAAAKLGVEKLQDIKESDGTLKQKVVNETFVKELHKKCETMKQACKEFEDAFVYTPQKNMDFVVAHNAIDINEKLAFNMDESEKELAVYNCISESEVTSFTGNEKLFGQEADMEEDKMEEEEEEKEEEEEEDNNPPRTIKHERNSSENQRRHVEPAHQNSGGTDIFLERNFEFMNRNYDNQSENNTLFTNERRYPQNNGEQSSTSIQRDFSIRPTNLPPDYYLEAEELKGVETPVYPSMARSKSAASFLTYLSTVHMNNTVSIEDISRIQREIHNAGVYRRAYRPTKGKCIDTQNLLVEVSKKLIETEKIDDGGQRTKGGNLQSSSHRSRHEAGTSKYNEGHGGTTHVWLQMGVPSINQTKEETSMHLWEELWKLEDLHSRVMRDHGGELMKYKINYEDIPVVHHFKAQSHHDDLPYSENFEVYEEGSEKEHVEENYESEDNAVYEECINTTEYHDTFEEVQPVETANTSEIKSLHVLYDVGRPDSYISETKLSTKEDKKSEYVQPQKYSETNEASTNTEEYNEQIPERSTRDTGTSAIDLTLEREREKTPQPKPTKVKEEKDYYAEARRMMMPYKEKADKRLRQFILKQPDMSEAAKRLVAQPLFDTSYKMSIPVKSGRSPLSPKSDASYSNSSVQASEYVTSDEDD